MLDRDQRTVWVFLIGFAVLFSSHTNTGAAEIDSIKISKRQITDNSTEYFVEYSSCRHYISVNLFKAFDSPEMLLFGLRVAVPCPESLSVQIAIFQKLLEHVAAERPDIRKAHSGSLPSIDFSEEFIASIARKAYASKQWKREIAGKKSGASVNKETLNLLKQSSVYDLFIAMFARQGMVIRLTGAEKAFLAPVTDVAARDAKHQDLSDLPKNLLIPGQANVSFKIVPDGQ